MLLTASVTVIDHGRELGMTGTWVGKIVDAGFFGGHQGLA